ncbi:MAG: class I SAM-dependent methyltransferase [Phenylobacterium sp.]|uniref:class I SAM-dependent methyltransferase n=1 Tax=Phenylobacterium sp. TaxID=1871053 RepID=UPI002723696D|nr:class I SAM-dependent methyltransferase [Phenylobacterium sp.]MDO8901275.1 class I SAM-dependent methyltransferase [Phenylobacterium sp.]
MTSFYERAILPRLLTCACGSPAIMRQRARLVPQAHGRVLELGVGGGLNLAFYDPSWVDYVTGIDPSPQLRDRASAAPRSPNLRVAIEAGEAEALPFADHSFDSVVCTFTLCSVRDPAAALAEARRVLAPGGDFYFCEHGLSPEPGVARWQTRLDPLWSRLAGGCHLNRPVADSITAAGFRLGSVEKAYLPKTPRFAGWNEWGAAQTN